MIYFITILSIPVCLLPSLKKHEKLYWSPLSPSNPFKWMPLSEFWKKKSTSGILYLVHELKVNLQ